MSRSENHDFRYYIINERSLTGSRYLGVGVETCENLHESLFETCECNSALKLAFKTSRRTELFLGMSREGYRGLSDFSAAAHRFVWETK